VRNFYLYLIVCATIITNITILKPLNDANLVSAANITQSSKAVELKSGIASNDYTVYNNYAKNNTSCNCVVFRMDDIQDDWIRSAQIDAMNLFLSKKIPLSLGIIMNSIGNDPQVINKIKEGINGSNPLFELALHGWDHVDYTKLSESEQKDTLEKAASKMVQLFGYKSNIFITPYGPFSNSTIKAMNNLDIRILSSAMVNEQHFDNGRSIAFATSYSGHSGIGYSSSGNDMVTSLSLPPQSSEATVYHLPGMSLFYDDESGKPPIKTPIEQILAETKNNIKKYGYSVIVFHPQDFVERDDKGNVIGNGVKVNEVNDLSRLIDSIVQEKVRIVHFSTVIKYIKNNDTQSVSSLSKPSLQCSSGWGLATYFTPVETDFNGSMKAILAVNEMSNHTDNGSNRSNTTTTITASNNNGTYSSLSMFTSFLDAVQEYGYGKTKEGNYIGYYNNQYHLSSDQLNSIGKKLKIGDVAVDPSIIPLGTKVTLPTLPAPWNNLSYLASDTGDSVKGKHISVYIGEGRIAEKTDAAMTLKYLEGNSTLNGDIKACYF
jgi:3D (Asp-Asp-Asp) domain-containing protein/peptidoglycan/xylan/chitin deacetylase (PgdA/CDA1 family)